MNNTSNNVVILPPGSDRYCEIPLNSEGWTKSTFPRWSFYEYREWSNTVTGRATNFNTQYPAWNFTQTYRYREINKNSGAIQYDTGIIVRKGTPTYAFDYRDRSGRYIGITNQYDGGNGTWIIQCAVGLSGREDVIYGFIGEMNEAIPLPNFNGWWQYWSHTYEGFASYRPSGDGICYANGNIEPPNSVNKPQPKYLGIAAPPPPPPLDMNCCDCNTISTILAEQIIAEAKQHEATRELIDRRTIEGLREINEMLQNMQIDLNLQPIIDRLNELEANLWNGLLKAGS
ncbi:hypothetical protein [Microcoleus sp. Pol10D4]|uniref:hypothetical protein n=1 Tax=Microcoleus sp. Pol10D4 TaxID=3055387 RepID=UPI002FD5D8EE